MYTRDIKPGQLLELNWEAVFMDNRDKLIGIVVAVERLTDGYRVMWLRHGEITCLIQCGEDYFNEDVCLIQEMEQERRC